MNPRCFQTCSKCWPYAMWALQTGRPLQPESKSSVQWCCWIDTLALRVSDQAKTRVWSSHQAFSVYHGPVADCVCQVGRILNKVDQARDVARVVKGTPGEVFHFPPFLELSSNFRHSVGFLQSLVIADLRPSLLNLTFDAVSVQSKNSANFQHTGHCCLQFTFWFP